MHNIQKLNQVEMKTECQLYIGNSNIYIETRRTT